MDSKETCLPRLCQATSKHVVLSSLVPDWQPFSLHQEPSDRTFERQLLLLLRSYMKYIISCAAAALALMMPLES